MQKYNDLLNFKWHLFGFLGHIQSGQFAPVPDASWWPPDFSSASAEKRVLLQAHVHWPVFLLFHLWNEARGRKTAVTLSWNIYLE